MTGIFSQDDDDGRLLASTAALVRDCGRPVSRRRGLRLHRAEVLADGRPILALSSDCLHLGRPKLCGGTSSSLPMYSLSLLLQFICVPLPGPGLLAYPSILPR